MLQRIHANNYRCFIDFEYRPDRCEFLIGPRGTGRSSLIEILDNLQSLLSGWLVADAFFYDCRTLWRPDGDVQLEVEVACSGERFTYRVDLSIAPEPENTWLTREELRCDGQLAFAFSDGIGRIHVDGRPVGDAYESDGYHSALSQALRAGSDERLQRFHAWWNELWLVRIGNHDITRGIREAAKPGGYFDSFVHWYRQLVQNGSPRLSGYHKALGEVLAGFQRIQLTDNVSQPMHVVFANPLGGAPAVFPLDELTQEERTIVELYSLPYLALQDERVLFVDAPYSALERTDLVHWYDTMMRRAHDNTAQVLLVVNEQSIVNDMSFGTVRRFERANGGPVRCHAPAPQ